MAKLGKIPRLDFVPNPADYRPPGKGNGKLQKSPRQSPPRAIDFSPRLCLELSVEQEPWNEQEQPM